MANPDAIRRIDQEIKSIVKVKNSHDISKDTEENVKEASVGETTRKCKFYNVGFCKYKQKGCRLFRLASKNMQVGLEQNRM